MSRNVLVAIVAMLVFVVVAGAVYLELAASVGARDLVWEVSRSVSAGELLTPDNVQQQRIPHAGGINYFTGQLQANVSRASHDMGVGTILFQDDVLNDDLALVNLTLKTPPQLTRGETIDVYAQQGSQTVLVGRRLMVDQVSSGGGASSSTSNSVAVLVAASDEPHWISLQAGNVSLFAARSSGIGVPQLRAQTVQDAIAALSGGATGGTGTGIIGQTPATPLPTPSPTKKP